MHLHPGEWKDIPPKTQRFIAERFPFPFQLTSETLANSILDAKSIVAQMDQAGLNLSVLFAVYAPRTVGVTTNEQVLVYLKKFPNRFLGLASLRVDQWKRDRVKELKKLEEALKEKNMVGIKLAHAHQHFRMDDPRYFEIYELAGRLGKPLYLHTGTSPFPGTAQEPAYTHPDYLEEAIKRHPKATFILGHMGHDFINKKIGALDSCFRLAKTYPNVFMEPSAFGSTGSDPSGKNLPEVMKRVRAAGLIDRVIYGSDGPQSPGFVQKYLQATIRAMKMANYTSSEMRAVLSENFVRVFRPPVKP